MLSIIEAFTVYIIISNVIFIFTNIILAYYLFNVPRKESRLVRVPDRKLDPVVKIFGFSDIDLPEVTILLPVYREEVTLPYLLRSISQFRLSKEQTGYSNNSRT